MVQKNFHNYLESIIYLFYLCTGFVIASSHVIMNSPQFTDTNSVSSPAINAQLFNCLELFSGSGNISRAFEQNHFNVCSVDIRKRKGTCEPTLQADIFKLNPADLPFQKVHVLWASLPCTAFSYGAGNYYFDSKRSKPAAEQYIKLLERTIFLIAQIAPTFIFIENPRGHLRYNKVMTDFLAEKGGMIKYITLSSYGFPTTKPTDIFTNALDWESLPPNSFGRGAKNINSTKSLRDMTVIQRQSTPILLAQSIAEYCVHKLQTSITPPFKYGSNSL